MEEIRESFLQIEDTRHAGYVEHNLVDVLILIMGAVVSGITELADMMVYFASKIEFYREHFGIEKYPSKSTLSRILNMIDGDAVGQIIVQIMRKNAESIGDIIAVDDKAIRSTGKMGKAHSFLQILTAYATESGVTLGQAAISYEDKTNEIPVFPATLKPSFLQAVRTGKLKACTGCLTLFGMRTLVGFYPKTATKRSIHSEN